VSEEAGEFGEWTRAHPVTPVINAFQGFVAIGVAFLAQLSSGSGDRDRPGMPPVVVWGFFLVGLIVVGFAFMAWRVNEYRIGDDAVYQRKGVVFKQHRKARLDRLQAVDVVQPLFARIFGFAETKIEVAGGSGSTVSLRFLTLDDAESLRNEVLALAAGYRGETAEAGAPDARPAPPAGQGAPPVEGWAAPQAEESLTREAPPALPIPRPRAAAAVERRVYEVPFGRLIGSILFSWTFVVVALAAVLIGVSMTLLNEAEEAEASVGGSTTGGITSVVFALVGVTAILWGQLNANANFSAGIAADGVRLSHGLLDTRRQTVPPGRVQALNIKQSLLWRRFDWWKITINVAGYQDQREAVSTLLPVGTRQQALDALWLVLPDLGDPDPAGTISTAMGGKGDENGFTASPARSWIFDPFQWRRRGVRSTERALLIRRGLFVREFFVVPHERTQSLAIRQGPLQRWLDLATIEVHSTRGVVRPVAGHLDLDDATAFIDDQSRRAREGRRRQTPEQWMEAVSR
jgi:putative membrane protein